MRRLVPLLALAAVCACKPAPDVAEQEPAPAAAPAPAATGPFDGEINALGTEPFWAVEIRPGSLKMTRPDAADLVVPNPGPRVEFGKAVWPAQGLVVTLTEGQCSDGMSDRTYPWFAEVVAGIDTYKGCATQAAALAAQPAP